MMRPLLILTGSVSFVLNWLYIAYGSDRIAAVTGVFFSLFVFPFMLWALLTVGLVLVSGTRLTINNVEKWGWLLASVGGAYLPVFLLWVVLSLAH
jgi:hypothetical protein